MKGRLQGLGGLGSSEGSEFRPRGAWKKSEPRTATEHSNPWLPGALT